MLNAPRLAAALASWPMLAIAQGATAPLTAETLWQLKRVSAPAVSPDGKVAVYAMTAFDAENDKGDADLYRVATAGGKPERLTSMKGNESAPAWSPDGRYIAFVAKRGEDKQAQLYVIAPNGHVYERPQSRYIKLKLARPPRLERYDSYLSAPIKQ